MRGLRSLLAAAPGAAEIGHFVPGMLNIRDYLLPPEPGVYGAVYNYYYSTDRRNDDHGDKIRSLNINPGPGPGIPVGIDVDLDLYALAVPFIWVSDWKVLGARYGAYVAPSFANASVEASLSIGRRRGGDADNASFARRRPVRAADLARLERKALGGVRGLRLLCRGSASTTPTS